MAYVVERRAQRLRALGPPQRGPDAPLPVEHERGGQTGQAVAVADEPFTVTQVGEGP